MILALIGAALSSACEGPSPPAGPGPPASPVLAGAVYVGPRPCATCHSEIAKRFARTGMGRAFYGVKEILGPAGRGSPVRPRLEATVEVAEQSLRYDVFEKAGRLFQRQYQVDSRGREVNEDVREAIYVLGSGNHSQSFITVSHGRLYQMPLCWYPEAGRWDLCPGYEVHNQYFQREVDDTCLFCHNGRVVRTGGFGNQFVEPIAEGIDCERCHGPGSMHVDRWSSPPRESEAVWGKTGDEPDPTIVNPKRLTADLRLQVCLQCHLGDSAQTERVMRRADHLDGFRPGLPLGEFLAVHRFRERLPGRFGLGAQADRLSLSRCFERTPGGIQCTTCHDPHVEVYDLRRADPGHFDAACSTCHSAHGCALEPAGRSEGCVGCHMRRAEPHDQRYTTFTDHWIRRVPSEGIEIVRSDFRMEPFLPGAVDAPSSDRLVSLGRAHFYKKIGTPEAAPMPWDYAIDPLLRAASDDPSDPEAPFYLGKIEMTRGRPSSAAPYFRRAAEIDPNHVEAWQELGSALLATGSLEEASRALERALTAGPRGDDVGAVINELARIDMQAGRLDQARVRLESARQAEPFSVEVTANLGVLASLEHDGAAAVEWFRKALALAPNRAALHLYLADALAGEGPQRNLDEALSAARRAVELAPSSTAAREKLNQICRAAGRADCARERPGKGA